MSLGVSKVQSIVELYKTNLLSFGTISTSKPETSKLDKNTQKYRLGTLLVQKGIVTANQLKIALCYQKDNRLRLGDALVSLNYVTESTLNRALIKQSWLKTLATIGAFVLAPVVSTSCFASDHQKANTIKVASIDKSRVPYKSDMHASFTPRSIGELAKEYYFSGHETRGNGDNVFFVIGRKLSDTSGVNISLFSHSDNNSHLDHWQVKNNQFNQKVNSESHFLRFDLQISLFKFTVKPNVFSFNKRKTLNNNRYTNTIPAIIMLTLKGRSIYETAGNETRLWSLNRAKKGVQRKAQLMLSMTKQF